MKVDAELLKVGIVKLYFVINNDDSRHAQPANDGSLDEILDILLNDSASGLVLTYLVK